MVHYDWEHGTAVMSNGRSPTLNEEVRNIPFKALGHREQQYYERAYVAKSKNGPEHLGPADPNHRDVRFRECRTTGGEEDMRYRDRLALFREQMKVKRAFESEEALELSYLPESSSTRRSKEGPGGLRSRQSRGSFDEVPAEIQARLDENASYATLHNFMHTYLPDNATAADPLHQDGEDLDQLSMYELAFRHPTLHGKDKHRVDKVSLKMYEWIGRHKESVESGGGGGFRASRDNDTSEPVALKAFERKKKRQSLTAGRRPSTGSQKSK